MTYEAGSDREEAVAKGQLLREFDVELIRKACFMIAVQGLCLLSLSAAHAEERIASSPWLAAERSLGAQLSTWFLTASQQLQANGKAESLLLGFEDTRSNEYGARLGLVYGYFDDLELGAALDIRSVQLTGADATVSVTGISDLYIFGRYRLVESFADLVLHIGTKIPTGYTPDSGPYTPSIGNGSYEIDGGLTAGAKLADLPLHASAFAAFRFRAPRVARAGGGNVTLGHEVPYGLDVGWSFSERIVIRGLMRGVYGLSTPAPTGGIHYHPIARQRMALGPSLGWEDERLWRGVRVDLLRTVAGLNTLQDTSAMLSAWIGYDL